MTAMTVKKTAALSGALIASIALSACQSTPSSPVIQRADATYETTGLGETKVKAQQNAINSANKTCRGKQVIVLTDEVRYNGILGEGAGRIIGQVGSVVGGILGNNADLSRDDDYEYMISFRCQ